MCELNDYLTSEVQNDDVSSHQTSRSHDVHVLLVDHIKESLVSMASKLEMCSYKVTMVELPSIAMAKLLNEGEQFDIVMADIHSPDYQGFKLLEEAVNRGIPVILMSTANEDDVLARRALECGASLFIRKPTCMEMVKCLWQFVVKERLRNNKSKNLLSDQERENSNRNSINSKEETTYKENNAVDEEERNNRKGKRKAKNQIGSNENEKNDDDQCARRKRKVGAHWSQDLHAKFLEVVNQLGEGKCYPKDILMRMNVPGLTRMQVASHLQKCRNDNWRPPREHSNGSHHPDNETPKRYGTMPHSCLISSGQHQQQSQEKSVNCGINLGFRNRISTNERGECSWSTQPSPGFSTSSVQNGMFRGISTEGTWIGDENGYIMNTHQLNGTNLHGFNGAATVENSLANLQNQRQGDEDFFAFPDMDLYMPDSFRLMQQGSRINQAQNERNYSLDEIFPN